MWHAPDPVHRQAFGKTVCQDSGIKEDPGHPESPIHLSLAKVGLLHSQVVQGEGSKLQEFCEKLAEEKPRGGTEEGVRRFC